MVSKSPLPTLSEIESEISSCVLFDKCSLLAENSLALSRILPGDSRRGSSDPRILIVTAMPDKTSAESVAYAGNTILNIRKMFLSSSYRVGMDSNLGSKDSVVDFLRSNRIYCTSAVKCYSGETNFPYQGVVDNCRNTYLDRQILSFHSLELILPMGIIATSAILHIPLRMISMGKFIGKNGKGVLYDDKHYHKTVIVLPHPSGQNKNFNPPKLSSNLRLSEFLRRINFINALNQLREVLERMGYPMKSLPPLEYPKGIFDY